MIVLAVCRRNDYGSDHERFSGIKRPLVSVETAQNGVFHRLRYPLFRSQAR
jgi:hypothetical protein